MRPLWGLIAICAMAFADSPDAAVLAAVHKTTSSVGGVYKIRRVSVSPGLDAVLAVGSPEGSWNPFKTALSGSTQAVFLQQRSGRRLLFPLLLPREGHDCWKRLERITTAEIVFSCWDEKFYHGPKLKLVFDTRSHSLFRQSPMSPLPSSAAFGRMAALF